MRASWASMRKGVAPYGWVILGLSTVINALAWSVRSTFALFYVAILGELAWGRGATALGYSLSWLAFVVFAPIAGWLHDRWGVRMVTAVGGALLGVALALTGQITSLTGYYVCFGILGAAGIAGMLIPATTIVTRWFIRSRGTAMGILSTSNAASAVIFYPVNAWLIAALGWRNALVAFGAIVAVVTIALALFYKDPPADAGASPSMGAMPRTRREHDITPGAGETWTFGAALRSTRLWAAVMMMLLGVIGFQIMATHQVAHAVDRGFSQTSVVWLFSFGAVCTMIGNLLGGWLSDRVGRGWVYVVGSGVAVGGIAALASIGGPRDVWLLVLYTISGIGFGMRIAQLSAIPADVFSGPQLGAILGVVQAGGGIGGAIGPFLGGWLFDVTGSYAWAFVAAAVTIAGSAVAAWIAARR